MSHTALELIQLGAVFFTLGLLGRLAQFAKGSDVSERLSCLTSGEEFLQFLDERDVSGGRP